MADQSGSIKYGWLHSGYTQKLGPIEFPNGLDVGLIKEEKSG